MFKDIRFALRQLLKQPAFTAIAVLTIALAIGATTAVLSLVNGLLVRPLPYREPQQLILLLQHFKSQNLERIPVSPPEFKDYETRARSFEKLGTFGYTTFNLAGEDRPERIAGATVTAGVLPLLGVSPIKGRFFQPEECTLGRDDVVIISARLWQRRFNSDPQIIGTKLLLDGKNFTVVGVMPAGFDFPLQLFNLGSGGQFGGRAEIWKPLAFTDDQMKVRSSRGFWIVGRLAPGISSSTSECYGDPLEHPQKETYWGNVNPIGPRSVYDEAKRFTESVTMAYRRYHKVDTRIVRIFNTYGPRMQLNDGRVIPNFMKQALRGEDLTVSEKAVRRGAFVLSAMRSTASCACQNRMSTCR